ncbi:hypothetical protein SISNIDRAFT_497497 [Sistotremastrum niveocremeum HHB9708]|uniref:Uncharacterized protein n=1 Tax=Sistotremastrum niveocremeum HHB9708 TaxID=1314777 RepID=A0A164QC12_9AGAM|nr:hypothetical protein SISNIDRAFT_497497 [Sistotremastrum niveocremeum HHB9708]
MAENPDIPSLTSCPPHKRDCPCGECIGEKPYEVTGHLIKYEEMMKLLNDPKTLNELTAAIPIFTRDLNREIISFRVKTKFIKAEKLYLVGFKDRESDQSAERQVERDEAFKTLRKHLNIPDDVSVTTHTIDDRKMTDVLATSLCKGETWLDWAVGKGFVTRAKADKMVNNMHAKSGV